MFTLVRVVIIFSRRITIFHLCGIMRVYENECESELQSKKVKDDINRSLLEADDDDAVYSAVQ